MKCHKLNNLNFIARRWHRLWCQDCRKSQHLDTMIGFGLMQMKSAPMSAQGLDTLLSSPMLPTGGRNARLASHRLAENWLRGKTRWAGAALIMGGVWWQYMNYIPPVIIPAKAAPEQNAFDYFKLAGKRMAVNKDLSNEVDEARQPFRDPPTRERRDARLKREGKPVPTLAQLLQQKALAEGTSGAKAKQPPAQAALIAEAAKKSKYVDSSFRMPYTLEEKQRLLDDNRFALTVLREGFKHPYGDVYARRWDTLFPDYTNFRQMARLLSLEAEVEAAKGDWNGAMQSSLDAMQIGVEISHGAPLIGRMVGNACGVIGEQEAWKALEHLDVRQTQAALARLQAIRARHAPYAETIQEEKWFMLEALRAEMEKPGWRANFMTLMGNSEAKGFLPGMLGWSNRVILRDVASVMDENIRRSRLPYAQSSKLGEVLDPGNFGIPFIFPPKRSASGGWTTPYDPIVQIMCPIFSGARYQDALGGETQPALMVTALALRAYRLEHDGRLPDRLEQLTPQYLAQIPADPFSADAKAPLRYNKMSVAKMSGTAVEAATRDRQPALPLALPYTLYSIGPDGKDNSGSPVDLMHQPDDSADPRRPKIVTNDKNRFQVLQIAVGDIVAGINTR